MSEECSANNIGGDNDAGFKRVMIGAGVGAGLGVVAGIGATAGVAGPLWGAGLVILFTAVAVAIVGGAIAQVVAWFTRLKTQNPATITIHGEPRCAGKNRLSTAAADEERASARACAFCWFESAESRLDLAVASVLCASASFCLSVVSCDVALSSDCWS